MMYNEFLELSGKSESYISYKEYTEELSQFIWLAIYRLKRTL